MTVYLGQNAISVKRLCLSLLVVNLGIFFVIASFLPVRKQEAYDPVTKVYSQRESYRDRWDIPWIVLGGTSSISLAIVILFSGKKSGTTQNQK